MLSNLGLDFPSLRCVSMWEQMHVGHKGMRQDSKLGEDELYLQKLVMVSSG